MEWDKFSSEEAKGPRMDSDGTRYPLSVLTSNDAQVLIDDSIMDDLNRQERHLEDQLIKLQQKKQWLVEMLGETPRSTPKRVNAMVGPSILSKTDICDGGSSGIHSVDLDPEAVELHLRHHERNRTSKAEPAGELLSRQIKRSLEDPIVPAANQQKKPKERVGILMEHSRRLNIQLQEKLKELVADQPISEFTKNDPYNFINTYAKKLSYLKPPATHRRTVVSGAPNSPAKIRPLVPLPGNDNALPNAVQEYQSDFDVSESQLSSRATVRSLSLSPVKLPREIMNRETKMPPQTNVKSQTDSNRVLGVSEQNSTIMNRRTKSPPLQSTDNNSPISSTKSRVRLDATTKVETMLFPDPTRSARSVATGMSSSSSLVYQHSRDSSISSSPNKKRLSEVDVDNRDLNSYKMELTSLRMERRFDSQRPKSDDVSTFRDPIDRPTIPMPVMIPVSASPVERDHAFPAEMQSFNPIVLPVGQKFLARSPKQGVVAAESGRNLRGSATVLPLSPGIISMTSAKSMKDISSPELSSLSKTSRYDVPKPRASAEEVRSGVVKILQPIPVVEAMSEESARSTLSSIPDIISSDTDGRAFDADSNPPENSANKDDASPEPLPLESVREQLESSTSSESSQKSVEKSVLQTSLLESVLEQLGNHSDPLEDSTVIPRPLMGSAEVERQSSPHHSVSTQNSGVRSSFLDSVNELLNSPLKQASEKSVLEVSLLHSVTEQLKSSSPRSQSRQPFSLLESIKDQLDHPVEAAGSEHDISSVKSDFQSSHDADHVAGVEDEAPLPNVSALETPEVLPDIKMSKSSSPDLIDEDLQMSPVASISESPADSIREIRASPVERGESSDTDVSSIKSDFLSSPEPSPISDERTPVPATGSVVWDALQPVGRSDVSAARVPSAGASAVGAELIAVTEAADTFAYSPSPPADHSPSQATEHPSPQPVEDSPIARFFLPVASVPEKLSKETGSFLSFNHSESETSERSDVRMNNVVDAEQQSLPPEPGHDIAVGPSITALPVEVEDISLSSVPDELSNGNLSPLHSDRSQPGGFSNNHERELREENFPGPLNSESLKTDRDVAPPAFKMAVPAAPSRVDLPLPLSPKTFSSLSIISGKSGRHFPLDLSMSTEDAPISAKSDMFAEQPFVTEHRLTDHVEDKSWPESSPRDPFQKVPDIAEDWMEDDIFAGTSRKQGSSAGTAQSTSEAQRKRNSVTRAQKAESLRPCIQLIAHHIYKYARNGTLHTFLEVPEMSDMTWVDLGGMDVIDLCPDVKQMVFDGLVDFCDQSFSLPRLFPRKNRTDVLHKQPLPETQLLFMEVLWKHFQGMFARMILPEVANPSGAGVEQDDLEQQTVYDLAFGDVEKQENEWCDFKDSEDLLKEEIVNLIWNDLIDETTVELGRIRGKNE